MALSGSDSFGDEESRRVSGSLKEQAERFPIWKPGLTTLRALEDENIRLRAENERLKQEAARQQSNLFRSSSVLRDERRWRAQAEHSWARSANSFTDWFENAAFAMTCVTGNGRIVHANRAALELLGYRREEYLGKQLVELIEEKEVVQRILQAVEGSPLPQNFLVHLRSRKGLLRPVMVSCQLIEQAGMPCVCLYTQEASEAKRQSRIRHHPPIRLRELGENMREVFWVSDVKRPKIIYVSSAFETIFEMKRKCLYRRASAVLDVVHPEDRARGRKTFRERFNQMGARPDIRNPQPGRGNLPGRGNHRGYHFRQASGKIFGFAGATAESADGPWTDCDREHLFSAGGF